MGREQVESVSRRPMVSLQATAAVSILCQGQGTMWSGVLTHPHPPVTPDLAHTEIVSFILQRQPQGCHREEIIKFLYWKISCGVYKEPIYCKLRSCFFLILAVCINVPSCWTL
jgi:hypothetical protein